MPKSVSQEIIRKEDKDNAENLLVGAEEKARKSKLATP